MENPIGIKASASKLLQNTHWQAYLVSLVVTSAVVLLRLGLDAWVGDRPLLVLFVLPIILCAYLGGLGPGLFSTFLVGLSTDYFLLPPTHSFVITSALDFMQWMVVILIGVLISVLNEALLRSRGSERRAEKISARTQDATERKVQGGFAFALVCLGVIAVVSYLGVTHLREDIDWVQHTREVIGGLDRLSARSTDAQNERRGYTITGDADFLTPYIQAERALANDLQHLKSLTADNPEQYKRVASLAELIDQQMAFDRDVIDARRARGFGEAQKLSMSGRGTTLHERTLDLIDLMKNQEDELLQERERRATASAQYVQSVIVSGGILAFVFVGLGFFLIRRDFEHRRIAEAERDRFFSLSLDLLCIASSDGYFKRVNPAVQDMLGWTPEEFLARPFIEFVHPDDHAATLQEVRKQMESGQKVLRFENRYLHKDGSWVVLSWASVPYGTLMYAIARDMTQHKQSEARITRLNEDLQAHATRLEAANKELEAFSYSVSHDLRAPLRHVQGYLQMLTREIESSLSDKAKRYLDVIHSASREMGQLIDELLSFSRMGRVEMKETRVELDSLVKAARQDLELVTRDRNIQWHIAALPAVQGDIAMLKQVVINLLDNAVKYTRQRDPAVIEIGQEGFDDGMPVFFVRDNGAGFDMQYADKLFGVFQRLHRADEFEGTGIGLANVRRIVTRHGGRTWAHAELGQGATLYFTLKPATTAPLSKPGASHEHETHLAGGRQSA